VANAPTPEQEATAFELRFEYANENRQATINLGGTGVAILTFLLVFLYGRFDTTGWGAGMFRITLVTVVLSIFFLGVSGSYYYFLIEVLERGRTDASGYLRTADACFVAGLALLMLEPALILLTLQIFDVGAIAVALWAISLAIIARGRRSLGSGTL